MRLPDRLKAALLSLSKQERHRRKAEKALLGRHRDDLSPKEAAEIFEHKEMVHVWRTGELPIVAEIVGSERPQRSDFALKQFEADPLGAPILPDQLDEATHFLGAIKATTLRGELTEAGASDLERTGAWYAWEIRQLLERGKR